MKRGWLISLVLAFMVAVVGASAASASPGPKQGPKGGSRHGRLMAELKLTAEQEQKILEIRQKHAREVLPIRQELQKKRLELRRLWSAEKPDAAAIEGKMKEMVPLQVKLRMKALAVRDEIKTILTPEQQKIFESFRPGRGHRRPGCGKNANLR